MTVSSKVKQTIASLKGSENTLRIYAIQTKNEEEKFTYEEALSETSEVIKELEERLKVLEFEEPQYKGF